MLRPSDVPCFFDPRRRCKPCQKPSGHCSQNDSFLCLYQHDLSTPRDPQLSLQPELQRLSTPTCSMQRAASLLSVACAASPWGYPVHAKRAESAALLPGRNAKPTHHPHCRRFKNRSHRLTNSPYRRRSGQR